jgi:tyrosyl-tRNA synthetase
VDAVVKGELAPSKSEARRLMEGNGVSLNEQKVTSADAKLVTTDFQNGFALLKRGKQLLVLYVN